MILPYDANPRRMEFSERIGRLTGFAGGLGTKAKLLRLEGRALAEKPSRRIAGRRRPLTNEGEICYALVAV
jgi:hypothetical protein